MSRQQRRRALLGVADSVGCQSVVLRRPANVAWYTGGLDIRVDHSDDSGVASVVITADGEWILADVIEAPRLRVERQVALDLEVVEHPWHLSAADTMAGLVDGGATASDLPDSRSERDLSARIAPLRYVLDAEAIEQYRQLGADTRAIFDEVALLVRPDMTELGAAALLAAAARRRNGATPVLLVAGSERTAKFRHPLPTPAPLGSRVMLVACVERYGLFASLTRFVDFVPPPADLAARTRATDEILTRMRTEATRPGRTLGAAFDDCRRFYAEAGYPDEWKQHHQGGMAGYRSREVIARPGDGTEIQRGQAFAWNPSVAGTKSEETIFVIHDGAEVLT